MSIFVAWSVRHDVVEQGEDFFLGYVTLDLLRDADYPSFCGRADGGVEGFVGAGVGFATVDYELSHKISSSTPAWIAGKGKDAAYMWNIFAGVSYDLSANLALDLGYRYTRYGDFDAIMAGHGNINGSAPIEGALFWATATLASHKVTLGARYAF